MSKSAKTIPLAKEPKGRDAGSLLSAWSPLRESVFRALWIATVVSNIGTWMQDVGESWLMTSLTPSPVLVALVETAGSLPVVLVALLGHMTPGRLLLLTFLLGVGTAMSNPAWQAITPELVPPAELPAAIALS